MKPLLLSVCLGAGLALTVSPAQAATIVQRNIPFEATIDDCGETITLSGSLIAIFTEQRLGGGGLLITSHFQPQGVRGSSSSGAIYHATGLTRTTEVYVPSGGSTYTHINRFHIVGTAGAPTYYVKETVHYTVASTGNYRLGRQFLARVFVASLV
jgi:hypothetical protein